jgi:hypothetical protein
MEQPPAGVEAAGQIAAKVVKRVGVWGVSSRIDVAAAKGVCAAANFAAI